METWTRSDGSIPRCQPGHKSYDASRKKVAHFLGMDFLFAQREYMQSIQTDNTGCKVLVNSNKVGDLLTVRPVPKTFEEKPWFNRKFRFPREYLGIPKIEERIKKLSYLVHVLTQNGIPNRSVLKGLNRLSKVWYHTRYEDMRKHVKTLTLQIIKGVGLTRSPWKTHKVLSNYPHIVGEKIHENGIVTPLWSRAQPSNRRANST